MSARSLQVWGWLKQGVNCLRQPPLTHPCGSRGCDSGDRRLQGCNSCSGGLAEKKKGGHWAADVIAMQLTCYAVDLQLIQQNDRGTHRQRQNPPREQQRVHRVQLRQHLHQLRQQGKHAAAQSRSAHVAATQLSCAGLNR